MQALLYFLGYDKQYIVEPGTQKMFWKAAKCLLDESFIEKMSDYTFQGPKDGKYEKYQTLNYIEKIITGIEPNDVTEFNMCAGRLFTWLKLAIENRKLDVVRRAALIQKEREERDSKIKAKEERDTKRNTDLEEAKTKFVDEHKEEIEAYENYIKQQTEGVDEYGEEEDEEGEEGKDKEPPTKPEFEEKEFLETWDNDNPEVVIAEQTDADVDNDWELTEDELQAEIKKFWVARGAE